MPPRSRLELERTSILAPSCLLELKFVFPFIRSRAHSMEGPALQNLSDCIGLVPLISARRAGSQLHRSRSQSTSENRIRVCTTQHNEHNAIVVQECTASLSLFFFRIDGDNLQMPLTTLLRHIGERGAHVIRKYTIFVTARPGWRTTSLLT